MMEYVLRESKEDVWFKIIREVELMYLDSGSYNYEDENHDVHIIGRSLSHFQVCSQSLTATFEKSAQVN